MSDAENDVFGYPLTYSHPFTSLSGKQLIAEILKCNRNVLNYIVPDNHFPAWDIAQKLDKYGLTPTPKQEMALRNVYEFYVDQQSLEDSDVDWYGFDPMDYGDR